MGLLDGELKAAIYDGIAPIMLSVSLKQETGGTFDPNTNKRTGHTVTTYTAKGFRDDSSSFFEEAGITRDGDMVALLLQDSRGWSPSVATPAPGDVVTVQGESGTVLKALQDPAQATWILDCKR